MTGGFRLVYSPESVDDLRRAYDAIKRASGSSKTAGRTIGKIRTSLRALKSMPARHETLDWEPWKSRGVRRMVVGSYTVLYLIDDTERVVEIIRVFLGAPELGS